MMEEIFRGRCTSPYLIRETRRTTVPDDLRVPKIGRSIVGNASVVGGLGVDYRITSSNDLS